MAYTPPLSSAGVGSGLNVNDIVSKMMSLEQRPLTLLQAKVASTETKISSFGQVKAAMSALYDAANGLANLSTWRGKQVTTGDKGVVTGTATSTATAANFSLEVQSLAQAQALASGNFASGATMGADGLITVQKGRWSGSDFAAGSADAVQISISATDTLADVAAKITNSGSGITAVVVKGSSGDRLLVRNTATGEENGFSMSVQGGSSALAGLAYDQALVASGQAGMTRTADAKDAQLSINGMDVTSASNTVADVVPGVTLNLLKTTTATGPVDISIGADKDALKGKVKAFQEAFNKINSLLRNLSAYDDKSKQSQPLQGDSAVRGLQSTLNSLTQQPGVGGATLTSLGLEMKLDSGFRNPTLSLDETKLDAALNDLAKLEQALTGDGTTDGLITRIRDFAFAANGVNGDITTRTKGLELTKKSNEGAIEAMQLRLDQRQANMLKQYQMLDAKMASMNSLGSFLNAQVGQWNKG